MRGTALASGALLLFVSTGASAQHANMGATFHALEARAKQVTLTFPDAVVEVRRTGTHDIDGELRGREGRVSGRLRLPRGGRRVEWRGRRPTDPAQGFELGAETMVSLDWAAHQLYALHTDEQETPEEPVLLDATDGRWDGHIRRGRRAAARGRPARDLAGRLQAVEARFDEAVIRAARDTHKPAPGAGKGKPTHYSTFTATIHEPATGKKVGFVRWFESAQVLTWKIDGGREGYILPERMRGGWPFTPTMDWATVQAYQFLTQAAASLEDGGPWARVMRGLFSAPPQEPLALLARAALPVPAAALTVSTALGGPSAETFAPLANKVGLGWAFAGMVRNEPGCDRLHWLDNTIFRVCCDSHDRCYEARGCSESSWLWPFSGSWSCQRCNVAAVYCFCTLGNPQQCAAAYGGYGGGDGNNGGGGGCTQAAGGFCPIECQTCQAH